MEHIAGHMVKSVNGFHHPQEHSEVTTLCLVSIDKLVPSFGTEVICHRPRQGKLGGYLCQKSS